MIAGIVFVLLCICFAIYLFFCGIAYFRYAFGSKKNEPKRELPPASVIICARNEAENIQKNLDKVMEQDYPSFEVIVIDDCSWDSTYAVLQEAEKKYPRLKVLQIKEDTIYKHGKKLALTVAIKSAQYEHLVFTDADCFPATKNWLTNIMQVFDEKTEIVLGYGAYKQEQGFVNKIIRMDTFRIGLQYLSLATAGLPYMGVGRNLAYRKSFFMKQKGFAPFSQVPSGDDDLFVNKAATKYNTRIATGPDSVTVSWPKKNLIDLIHQKRRHVSTAQYYTPLSKFILALITFSQYFFWISAITLLFYYRFRFIGLAIIGIYIITQLLIQWKAMKQLGESKLLVYSLLLEWILLFFFYPLVATSNLLFKKVAWKT